MKRITQAIIAGILVLGMGQAGCAGASGQHSAAGETAISKNRNAALQTMLRETAPLFEPGEYTAGKIKMQYNLFTPASLNVSKKYPLVVFMADDSTVGPDAGAPLRQGYGGLIWATAQAQASNPCYVLVPQFSTAVVEGNHQKNPEAEAVVKLIDELIKEKNIDARRIYLTGQGMGGAIAMYLNARYPHKFAASLFVDSHWDAKNMAKLVENKFIFVMAETSARSAASAEAIEEAARKHDRSYTTASWSAELPMETQDSLASTMLGKGAPINIFTFEADAALPKGAQGNENMNSFDCAYRLAPLREWLFQNSLK